MKDVYVERGRGGGVRRSVNAEIPCGLVDGGGTFK
jgi:hypothetical protein